MKSLYLALAFTLASATAFAAGSFPDASPVPAQLQAEILEVATQTCGLTSPPRHLSTSVAEAAGETYFETVLDSAQPPMRLLVISGIGRLGGTGVIKVDCGV